MALHSSSLSTRSFGPRRAPPTHTDAQLRSTCRIHIFQTMKKCRRAAAARAGGLDDDAMRHRYQSELEAQSGRAAREVDDSDVFERRKRKLERARDSEAGKKFRF